MWGSKHGGWSPGIDSCGSLYGKRRLIVGFCAADDEMQPYEYLPQLITWS
jgi:hypothetical protein